MSNGFTSAWLAARGLEPAPKATKSDELEGDIQRGIIEHLDAIGHDCYYVWHRMDRPTTCRKGTPDFVGVYRGKAFGIEVKRSLEKPTPEQLGELMRIRMAGGEATAVWSVAEAVEFIGRMTK